MTDIKSINLEYRKSNFRPKKGMRHIEGNIYNMENWGSVKDKNTEIWSTWKGDTTGRTKKAQEKMRSNVYKRYIINPIIVQRLEDKKDKYTFVDQGAMGACSFASLTNMAELSRGPLYRTWLLATGQTDFKKVGKSSWFQNVYLNDLCLDMEGYGSWREAFTRFSATPSLIPLIQSVGYVSFRGRGDTWNPVLAAAISGPKTGTAYAEQVVRFIENKLNEGFVVAVPFLQHFITIIGYNDSKFLFLGSFGPSVDQGGLHTAEDIETVTKLTVGDAINDAIYTQVESVKISKSPKKKSPKKKSPKKKSPKKKSPKKKKSPSPPKRRRSSRLKK